MRFLFVSLRSFSLLLSSLTIVFWWYISFNTWFNLWVSKNTIFEFKMCRILWITFEIFLIKLLYQFRSNLSNFRLNLPYFGYKLPNFRHNLFNSILLLRFILVLIFYISNPRLLLILFDHFIILLDFFILYWHIEIFSF